MMPTLRAIHMWATEVGLPVLEFGITKFRRKQPALHYVMQETLAMLDKAIAAQISEIDPVDFARYRRYVLLTMRRAD